MRSSTYGSIYGTLPAAPRRSRLRCLVCCCSLFFTVVVLCTVLVLNSLEKEDVHVKHGVKAATAVWVRHATHDPIQRRLLMCCLGNSRRMCRSSCAQCCRHAPSWPSLFSFATLHTRLAFIRSLLLAVARVASVTLPCPMQVIVVWSTTRCDDGAGLLEWLPWRDPDTIQAAGPPQPVMFVATTVQVQPGVSMHMYGRLPLRTHGSQRACELTCHALHVQGGGGGGIQWRASVSSRDAYRLGPQGCRWRC